jgi:NDP-sugar pyrophosphorylase family protein
MKAVILCAGKGERLRPLTNKIPKPMILINNKPILEYLIMLCKKHGINEIFISTSYMSEVIKNYFGDGSKWGVKLIYSVEKENELPGTAGALKKFKQFLNETFFVIYGDNLTNLNLTKMLNFHCSKKGLGTIFVYKEPLADEKSTPAIVAVKSDGEIFDLIERPVESDKERLEKITSDQKYMNSGIYVLEPEIFNFIPEKPSDFMVDIFPESMKSEKLFAFRDNPYIREVGIFLRLNKAKEEIESGQISLDL